MIASSFLPSRFRGEQPATQPAAPSWLNKKMTPVLQLLSSLTSSHPIHTIVIVAVLASSTYMGLLEESLFDATGSVRRADWSSLAEGSRSLRVGPDTAWKWQPWDTEASSSASATSPGAVDRLALLTFVFPESFSDSSPKTAPLFDTVPVPENISSTPLPSTPNPLGAYSQDTSLAFAVPYEQAPSFTSAALEIPNHATDESETQSTTATRVAEEHGREKKMWIMKAAGVQAQRSSILRWLQNGWVEFLDLLKNAETLDIIIMVLGYLSMHLTFVSLFLSMRRLGSNFWLGTSVLFSSIFAFLFGLIVTTKLGVPVSMVLLSEGLPFLVVTIGFEKNIVLTKAVLTHALERRRNLERGHQEYGASNAAIAGTKKATATRGAPSVIQYAIQMAIKEKGFDIVRDYAIEILVLVLGAASGVQGGLQQFCFLAAWILVFDGILLFTFYTAILCIKLEINRIKRHVEMRRALEDDGVSRRVAENVAQSNDWPRVDGKGSSNTSIFGRQIKSTSVPKFKVLMVSGFVVINVLNLCTLPFRSADNTLPSTLSSMTGGLGGVVASPPVDPFKVAANGLDTILTLAKEQNREVVVTVLTPIKYELEYPSVHYALSPLRSSSSDSQLLDNETGVADFGYGGVGGRMMDSILKSLEDPVLSKWIIVALALSVALNGYLFNVARWGIKDPNIPDHPINAKELAQAETFNDTASASLPMGEYIPPPRQHSPPTNKPLTPALTDDEGEVLSSSSVRPLNQKESQLSPSSATAQRTQIQPASTKQRTPAEMEQMLKELRASELTDSELVSLSLCGKLPGYALEETLQDFTRAVKIRRAIITRTKATAELTGFLDQSELPYKHYNWAQVWRQCCENVVGYMPIPVGVAGPIVIDGQSYFLPMATTEGVLVASTSRGCKAINAGGGAVTVLTGDGMTRGPCLSFETLERAGAAKIWLDSEAGQTTMRKAFNSTSRFARLDSMKTALAGTNLYIRFKTTTGDAMGMNMISKGVEHALDVMMNEAGFEDMNIVSLSGNYCIDKKAAALNWIDGRGKSVVAEAIIPGDVVKRVLKTDVDTLVELNVSKNFIGSAMAGAIGGFNAHAANIVAAMFLATGQDPAQVVESANCITIMKNLRGSLQISVSMPSIEVGTLGGGTILEPQGAMLDILGVRGPHLTNPGENARRLARIIAAATLAGELSLCSALAAGHLVKAHMAHNRSQPPTRTTTPAPAGAMTPVSLAMTNAAEKTGTGTVLSSAAIERSKR
ncbi:hmg-reductase [Niveomyces insectorum RCEF 264]|uniref:3-hydroxy-3-methylglutaryl coenzyme A reductase n=1 Tax=Niveomyces insectorum RCEF 264 TaxID=1081102 RepID=A0A167VR83_9HYPO|nr:hmg-reductase [Niveomyces insectorum RCEF 264]